MTRSKIPLPISSYFQSERIWVNGQKLLLWFCAVDTYTGAAQHSENSSVFTWPLLAERPWVSALFSLNLCFLISENKDKNIYFAGIVRIKDNKELLFLYFPQIRNAQPIIAIVSIYDYYLIISLSFHFLLRIPYEFPHDNEILRNILLFPFSWSGLGTKAEIIVYHLPCPKLITKCWEFLNLTDTPQESPYSEPEQENFLLHSPLWVPSPMLRGTACTSALSVKIRSPPWSITSIHGRLWRVKKWT